MKTSGFSDRSPVGAGEDEEAGGSQMEGNTLGRLGYRGYFRLGGLAH